VNVLILCTHNSARSVLAEALLNHWAVKLGANIRAYSAGSTPSGRINPLAVEVLQAAGIDTTGLRSKNWDEFADESAPHMNVVITVCDSAAQEACPYWPGGPVKLHWGYPDPSNAPGDADTRRQVFEVTRQAIGYRMLQLAQLQDIDAMSEAELRAELQAIQKT